MGRMRITCTGCMDRGIKGVHHVVLQPHSNFWKYQTFSMVGHKLGGSGEGGGGGILDGAYNSI